MSDERKVDGEGIAATEVSQQAGSTQQPAQVDPDHVPDASRAEVALYAFGNIEGALADRFPDIMNSVLIMVMGINPLVLGMILGIRWSGTA